jgi:hypothetical protein
MHMDEQSAAAIPAFNPPAVEASADVAEGTRRWEFGTRIAFRFCLTYFGLYIVLTQVLTSLLFATTNDSGAFELDMTPPAKAAVVWMAEHVFRIAHPIVTAETGSGDRVYDWVELACILALAILGTVIWSLLDRKRRSYVRLHAWFHVVVRFSLAATMFTYGASKVIPLQMPFPFLSRLIEPYGRFSPMGVLWSSIGAAPGYEIFAGCAEMLGGMLLILPRTTMLGALVCLADATQVFTLNMTYDVPVKLLSFHLILLSLLVLAPDAKRFANVFFLDRPAPASPNRPLFRTARANRIALAVQLLAGAFLIGANLYGSVSAYQAYGAGRPKSPLYGIWNVEDFALDGQSRPPLLTDARRWRRIVFDFPQFTTIYGMNEEPQSYGARIDTNARTIALTESGNGKAKGDFSFQRPDAGHLILNGIMSDHKVHVELELYRRSKFLLVNRGFHWVQDYPFNR